MEWKRYQAPVIYGGKKPKQINIEYDISYTDDKQGVFFICARYGKADNITSYDVFYQDYDHVKNGGANFVLAIRKCMSFTEGRQIAEKFYNDFKDGNHPKCIGTQYIPDDTHLQGPFID